MGRMGRTKRKADAVTTPIAIVDMPGMRLVNPTNEHAHWRTRSTRAKLQRNTARLVMMAHAHQLVRVPLVITIVRLGRGTLDSDSLPPSGKHVRDGIADALGIDDGDESKVTWLYRQERAVTWGARIEIARREEAS